MCLVQAMRQCAWFITKIADGYPDIVIACATHQLNRHLSMFMSSSTPATSQVTIVAVLQRLGANEDLFALVFGESCLNDAVRRRTCTF